MDKIVGSNQGESSNEWKGYKAEIYIPGCENRDGNQSGTSDTAGLGTSSGTQAPFQNPSGEINGTYSSENRAAKYKYPSVSEDVPSAGANQYQ